MKKLLTAALAAILALSALALTACAPKTVVVDDTAVIITPSDKILAITDDSVLADYMNKLVERGELEFTAADGMVTSIGGKANTTARPFSPPRWDTASCRSRRAAPISGCIRPFNDQNV